MGNWPADRRALHSAEVTSEIQRRLVGRAVTGLDIR